MPYPDQLTNLPDCPVMITLSMISSKWKVVILWALTNGKKRFGELRRLIGISQKVLTEQLRELEADGLIIRTTYPEVPPRVEYELTALGETLRPVYKAMWDWGLAYKRSQMRDKPDSEVDSIPATSES